MDSSGIIHDVDLLPSAVHVFFSEFQQKLKLAVLGLIFSQFWGKKMCPKPDLGDQWLDFLKLGMILDLYTGMMHVIFNF